MEYRLSEEERQIRETARRFARRELLPRRGEINRSGRLPADLRDAFLGLGLLRGPYAEAHGGANGTFTGLTVAVEELAYVSLVPCWMLLENFLLAHSLMRFGSEFLKNAYLPGLVGLESTGALAFTEPDTGSDPSQLATRAERTDGGWVLNGTKRFITYSGLCDHMILFARTAQGVTAFLVEPRNAGYRAGRRERFFHDPALDNGDAFLEDYFAPDAHVIGKVGQGFEILLETEAVGKVLFCAFFSGMAARALDLASDYARNRTHRAVSIGRKFQMTQWKLARMSVRARAMRAFLLEVSAFVDLGRDVKTDAAALKLVTAEDIRSITADAMEIHGAYGLSEEYEISDLFRSAACAASVMGSLDIQRVIVARQILERKTP